MDDRIAEIREALKYSDSIWDDYFDELQDAVGVILSAAREYADLLDSDALIIRRDERLNLLNLDLLQESIGAGRPPSIAELGELWEAAAILLSALVPQGEPLNLWVLRDIGPEWEIERRATPDDLIKALASSQGVEP